MTLVEWIKTHCIYHHSATRAGYISRRSAEPVIEAYKGRFGTGFKLSYPRWDTTTYKTVEYWILGGN